MKGEMNMTVIEHIDDQETNRISIITHQSLLQTVHMIEYLYCS